MRSLVIRYGSSDSTRSGDTRIMESVDEVGGGTFRQREQQSPVGLGIEQQFFFGSAQWPGKFDAAQDHLAVAGVGPGCHPTLVHGLGTTEHRRIGERDIEAHTRTKGHFQGMARQAEARDVGSGMNLELRGRFRCNPVECHQCLVRLPLPPILRHTLALEAGFVHICDDA